MAEEYFHQDYPKYKFNKAGGFVVVSSTDEEAKLDGEWFDSLREMGVETCPQASAVQPMAALFPGFVPPAPPAPPVVEEGANGGRY